MIPAFFPTYESNVVTQKGTLYVSISLMISITLECAKLNFDRLSQHFLNFIKLGRWTSGEFLI